MGWKDTATAAWCPQWRGVPTCDVLSTIAWFSTYVKAQRGAAPGRTPHPVQPRMGSHLAAGSQPVLRGPQQITWTAQEARGAWESHGSKEYLGVTLGPNPSSGLRSLKKEQSGWESCKDAVISAEIGTWRRTWRHKERPRKSLARQALQ